MKKFVLLMTTFAVFSCSTVEESGEASSDFVCEMDSVSYVKDIVPILEANCYECHNEEEYAKKADGNLLQGYDALKKKVDKGLVVGNINHEKGFIGMPYRRAKIDSCARLKIMKWVEMGAPNN